MTAQCEASDLYRSSMDVNRILEPITTSSFVDEVTNANTSTANIAQAVNKPKLGTYLIDRTIGKGIFSVVKLATHTITGINLAIKIIDKTRLDAENRVKIYRESEILKKLHHPNIVKLFQVMETPRLLYIAMEFLPNGEVFDYIANHGRFSEPVARVKFMDVLHAVDYIHSMGIVHRDIKAENLLFDAQMNIKLTDFSFGTHYYASSSQPLLTTWCGSPPYAAPEIFKGEPYVGTKADIWSLGVVLYVMVCGTLPFDAQPLPHLKNQVLSACFRVPYWLSLTCERLIRSMLCKQPSKRPTAKEIMQHPWFYMIATTIGPTTTISTTPATTTPLPSSNAVGLSETALTSATSVGDSSCHENLRSRVNRPFSSVDNTSTGLVASSISSSLVQTMELRQHPVPPEMSSSAHESEIDNLDELVLLIMESLGMNRSQILESLDRHAYDHLMATYLLLREKLRYHQHSLSLGPLYSMQSDSRARNEYQNPVVTELHCRTHAKHSRVDSAVDMQGSTPETEFHDASVLSVRVSDSNHYHGVDHTDHSFESANGNTDNSATRQHRFSTPLTTTATTNFTRTAMVTDTINGNSFRQQSHQSCGDEPVCHPRYHNQGPLLCPGCSACPVTSVLAPAITQSYYPHDCNHYHEPHSCHPHPPESVGSQPPSVPPLLVHSTIPPSDISVVSCDGGVHTDQPSHTSFPSHSPDISSIGLSENQVNFPWFIHGNSTNQTPASPVKRRTLVRRKYGVFNPPGYLDQLAQAMLVEQSSAAADAVSNMSYAIDEDQF